MGASSIRIGGGPLPSPPQNCKTPTSSPANPPFQILQIPHFKPCKSPNKASARPGMRLDWPRGHQRDHGRQLSSARRRPSHGSRARVDRRSHSGRPSWLRQDHDGSRVCCWPGRALASSTNGRSSPKSGTWHAGRSTSLQSPDVSSSPARPCRPPIPSGTPARRGSSESDSAP